MPDTLEPVMLRRLLPIAWLLPSFLSVSCVRVAAVADEQDEQDAAGAREEPAEVPPQRARSDAAPTRVAPSQAAQPQRSTIEIADPVEKVPQKLTLLSPGEEPRAPLRLRPEVGARDVSTLRMGMVVGMRIGTTDVAPRRIPSIEAKLEAVVLEVTDDAIRYRIETSAAEASGLADASERVAGAVERAVQSMRGTRGTLVVSSRGKIERIDLEIPDESDASLRPTLEGFRQSFNQMFAWLPEEPVGIGAKWSAITHVVHNDLELQQEAEYRLVTRQGDRVELEYDLRQHAVQGPPVQAPLPGGSLEVESHTATGSGRVVLDLGRVMPAEGDAKSAGATRTMVAMGGAPETVVMQLELDLTLQSR
jgi:hypothetical protein